MSKAIHSHDNPIINILFNVAAPVFILNKLSAKLGSKEALLLALAFPLLYGAYDLIKKKKVNYFSLLGLLNVLATGSLAIMGLTGIWFAVKEAGVFSAVPGWRQMVERPRFHPSPKVKRVIQVNAVNSVWNLAKHG